MQLDEALGERKAEPGALGLARVVAPDLLELLEHRAVVLLRDADAGVLDRDGDAGRVELRAHVDTAAVGGELHRVRKKVEQDLLELALVSWISLKSRTFSIAIAAWSAKVLASAICFSLNGRTSVRRRNIVPNGLPSRISGTASMLWCWPNFCARSQLTG